MIEGAVADTAPVSESQPLALPALPTRSVKGSVRLMLFASSTPHHLVSPMQRSLLTNGAEDVNEVRPDGYVSEELLFTWLLAEPFPVVLVRGQQVTRALALQC